MQESTALLLLKNRLDQARSELEKHKRNLDLPHPPASLFEQVEASDIAPALKRLTLYVLDNQGARSDRISADCAIGNVSDVHTQPIRIAQLKALGLSIRCVTIKSCNRFGEFTVIGHLFIRPTQDNQHWHPYRAANDE
jgi:hypothetical protein